MRTVRCLLTPVSPRVEDHNGRGHQEGRGRSRQAAEISALHGIDLDVETGQAEGPADHEEESRQPAQAAERLKGPGINQNAGSHAKGDHIRQRIVFHAEAAGGVRITGNLPVHAVQESGGQDKDGGGEEIFLERAQKSKEPAEKAAGVNRLGRI